MKTLVMTTIFVVTVVINAFGGNIQENFAYNESDERKSGGVPDCI